MHDFATQKNVPRHRKLPSELDSDSPNLSILTGVTIVILTIFAILKLTTFEEATKPIEMTIHEDQEGVGKLEFEFYDELRRSDLYPPLTRNQGRK